MSSRRTRARVRALVVGAILVLALGLASASTAGAAGVRFQRCGILPGPGARFAILAHEAHCRTARRVFIGLFAGQGRRRRDPATGQLDKVLDGWICGTAAGGFSCARLGARGKILPVNPRHLGPNIDAEAL